jgi:hypothetical protein
LAFAATLAFVLAATPAPIQALPANFTATYELDRDILGRFVTLARAEVKWIREGDEYQYVSRTQPTIGILAFLYGDEVSEASRGQLVDEAVRPERYEYELKGRNGRSDYIVFRKAKGEVEQHFNGETIRQHVPPGVLDRVSLQLAVMHDLAGGARRMQYLVADRGRLQAYHFDVKGKERVTTPLGAFDTLKVELTGQQRVSEAEATGIGDMNIRKLSESDRRTIFWCAPSLEFIPVQVEYIDRDGATYRLDIQSLEHPK